MNMNLSCTSPISHYVEPTKKNHKHC